MRRLSAKTLFNRCLLIVLVCGFATVQTALAAEEEKSVEPTPIPATGEIDLNQRLDSKTGIDFVCEADVYYKWRKVEKRKKSTRDPRSRNLNTPSKPMPTPVDAFYTTAGEHGLVGIDTKNRLAVRLPGIESEAMIHCRQTHQDQAACISSGLNNHLVEYNKMNYAARKAMLNALTEDCSNVVGQCLSAKSTEIKCYLNRPSNKALKAVEEDSEKSEDKKKKKK